MAAKCDGGNYSAKFEAKTQPISRVRIGSVAAAHSISLDLIDNRGNASKEGRTHEGPGEWALVRSAQRQCPRQRLFNLHDFDAEAKKLNELAC
jgi:hypothetical protein